MKEPELHALIDKADALLVRCEQDLMKVEDHRRGVDALDRAFGRIDFTEPTPSLLQPEELEEYRTAVAEVLDQLRSAHAAVPDLVTSVEAARHLLGRAGLGAMTEPAVHVIHFQPSPELGFDERDPLEVIRGLAVLGEVVEATPALGALPELDVLDPERCYLTWTIKLVSARSADELVTAFAALSPRGLTLESARELPS